MVASDEGDPRLGVRALHDRPQVRDAPRELVRVEIVELAERARELGGERAEARPGIVARAVGAERLDALVLSEEGARGQGRRL